MLWNSNTGSSLNSNGIQNDFLSHWKDRDRLVMLLNFIAPTIVGHKKYVCVTKISQGWNYARHACWISWWNSNTLAQPRSFRVRKVNLIISSLSVSMRNIPTAFASEMVIICMLLMTFLTNHHLYKRWSVHARMTRNAWENPFWITISIHIGFSFCIVITWWLLSKITIVHSVEIQFWKLSLLCYYFIMLLFHNIPYWI